MADTYSNQLKVVFVSEDISEMPDAILRENCFTVQHFSYESKHRRHAETGNTSHAEDASLLDISIRINTPDCGKELLAHMQDQERHPYSFLFNATFKPSGRIEDFDDGMTAVGYIVDIQEDFGSSIQMDQQEQMLMHIKLLINSITFIGKEGNTTLNI